MPPKRTTSLNEPFYPQRDDTQVKKRCPKCNKRLLMVILCILSITLIIGGLTLLNIFVEMKEDGSLIK